MKLIDRIFPTNRTPKQNLVLGIQLSAFTSVILYLVSWDYFESIENTGPIKYEVADFYMSNTGRNQRKSFNIIVIYQGEEYQSELLEQEWLAARDHNQLPVLYYNSFFNDVFNSRAPGGVRKTAYAMLILTALLFGYYQFLYRFNGKKRISDFYKKPPPWRR